MCVYVYGDVCVGEWRGFSGSVFLLFEGCRGGR